MYSKLRWEELKRNFYPKMVSMPKITTVLLATFFVVTNTFHDEKSRDEYFFQLQLDVKTKMEYN